MCARGRGSIINIAALSGLRPEPENLLFSMTKAAVVMLTKSYALELAARGVRVNAIAPGLVQTESSAAVWKDDHQLARHMSVQPLRHLGQPEEVAEVALLLASDRSSLITGQVFGADAGLSLV
jgi:NAD(P)-dependent dehydrogenase (short-subunit alcohol dehydrogenase family)